jgi:hypothetical protein
VVTYLLVVAGVLSVLWFAGVGLFFLRFVRLQQKQANVVNETDVQHLAADLSKQAIQLDELRLWLFLDGCSVTAVEIPLLGMTGSMTLI